jgi:hypothetical protein
MYGDPEPEPAQHTPGPWEVYTNTSDPQHPYILQSDSQRPSKVIAILFDDDPHTRPHNAAVLAAAPDLLDALIALFDNCEMIHKHWGDGDNTKDADAAIASARAAIRKATPAK